MNGSSWISAFVLGSGLAHAALAGTLLKLNVGNEPRLPSMPATKVVVVLLPREAPKPVQPEEAKPAPKTQQVEAPKPEARAARQARPAKEPPVDAEPKRPKLRRLAGLRLSNGSSAISVDREDTLATFGSRDSDATPGAAGKAITVTDAPVRRNPPSLVPLAALSRRPIPPELGAALKRHYPAELRRQGIEGEALVRAEIKEDGTVAASKLISESKAGFGAACLATLRTSQWVASLDKRGNPARTRIIYRCRFRVDG